MATVDHEILPAVAARLRAHIVELAGRAVPVTEILVTADNVPTLPIAVVAPLIQNFTHNGGSSMTVNEDFVIEFWLPAAKDPVSDGFWAYYDYNGFRQKIFDLFAGWRTPKNGSVRFISMDVEANLLATVLTFRMRAIYDVCQSDEAEEPAAVITFNICQPRAPECLPECEQEKDPCPPST